MYFLLNGHIQKNSKQVHINSYALNYGYGLFETLLVKNSKIFFFDEHFERFKKGCDVLGLSISFTKSDLYRQCCKLIKKNYLMNGAIKYSYFLNNKENLMIITNPKVYDDRPFKLTVSCVKRNPSSNLVYVKSNNYMENIIEKNKAVKKGYDECIFLNHDQYICEGSISNIFYVKNNIIYTPAVTCGLLPGIMRQKVIEKIASLNYELNISRCRLEDVLSADEVFITNSLLKIKAVCRINDTEYSMKNNTITQELKALFVMQ